jgi:translation initiation factor 2 subunit 2
MELEDIEENFELLLKQKKKKKKINIEINTINDNEVVDKEQTFVSYDEMLQRVLTLLNKTTNETPKNKLVLQQPIVQKLNNKKSLWTNFANICISLNRSKDHVMNYILTECCVEGSIDGNEQFLLRGKFDHKQIESILRKYIVEYVKCNECSQLKTEITKDPVLRLQFICCLNCGSKRSVQSIKSGFHATLRKDRIQAKLL